ncbi:uncharacterized protein LOC119728214 [Patiria miniata]|uniref:Uncharacterized protein n=1 Tax=Patiria miniata TaxID=46514 RepID=A0A913ZZ02_PATMI|nr:uncharacterized protein LOC119728214 [Patiria miniata]
MSSTVNTEIKMEISTLAKDGNETNTLGDGEEESQEHLEMTSSENKTCYDEDLTSQDRLSESPGKEIDEKYQGNNRKDAEGSGIPKMAETEGATVANKREDDAITKIESSETSEQNLKTQTTTSTKQEVGGTSPCSDVNPNDLQKTVDKPHDRSDKPTAETDNGLSKQPAKITQAIIIDLNIPQVTDPPQSRGHPIGLDRWTEGPGNNRHDRQGGGVCKSVDFSVPVSMDEVEAELARVVAGMTEDQSLFDPHECGRGATTNTPVTVMTDYAESVSQIQGRGLTTPLRENIYQHALSIMKKRCQSGRTATSNARTSYYRPKTPDNVVEENGMAFPNFSLPAVLANIDKPPLVQNPNCFFYVTQSRQHPIAPVKAWKGYEGNLYFQPVVCKKADLTPSTTPRENALNKATRRAYSTPHTKGNTADMAESQTVQLPQLPHTDGADGDNQTNIAPSVVGVRSVCSQRTTAPSRQKSFSRNASTGKSRASTARQLAILDKQAVFSRMDSNIREDIRWISGMDAMGTLHLGSLKLPRSTSHFYNNTGKHHKLKIQRGLVSHQLAAHDQSLPTLLGVHGGRLNDSADGVAKTKHLQSQYQSSKVSHSSDDEDRNIYSPNLYGGYSGPFTSVEQLRRDSSSSPRRGGSSPSSDMLLKDDSLHSLASVYKNPSNMPLCSSKEVLFRNREALFLTRPNYR